MKVINLEADAELIKTATESDGKEIAFNFGKSADWLVKQYSGEYLNFWTVTKKWIRAFAKAKWSKAELFFNDFDLFRRELWREVHGQTVSFPIEKERELLFIRNRLNDLLAV